MSALSPDQFRGPATDAIRELKASDPSKYWSVSEPGAGYRVHPVGQDGYVGIKDNKSSIDVGALVAKPGASGVTARAMGTADSSFPEHPQTLDAFDGHLPKIYAKHGFQETGRMKFDPAYAPPEWDEAKHGRPDVVMMARPAAQGSLFSQQFPTTPSATAPRPRRQAVRPAGAPATPLPGL